MVQDVCKHSLGLAPTGLEEEGNELKQGDGSTVGQTGARQLSDGRSCLVFLHELKQVPHFKGHSNLVGPERWELLRIESKYLHQELSVLVLLWTLEIDLAKAGVK